MMQYEIKRASEVPPGVYLRGSEGFRQDGTFGQLPDRLIAEVTKEVSQVRLCLESDDGNALSVLYLNPYEVVQVRAMLDESGGER